MATAIHVGHNERVTILENATSGAEHIAAVTPAVVRIRPCMK